MLGNGIFHVGVAYSSVRGVAADNGLLDPTATKLKPQRPYVRDDSVDRAKDCLTTIT